MVTWPIFIGCWDLGGPCQWSTREEQIISPLSQQYLVIAVKPVFPSYTQERINAIMLCTIFFSHAKDLFFYDEIIYIFLMENNPLFSNFHSCFIIHSILIKDAKRSIC